MFKVGDKIQCIDDSIQGHTLLELSKDMPNWITKGTEYTIREINDNKGIVLGILLEEVSNPVKYFKLVGRFQEPAFAQWRFRKIADAPIKLERLDEVKVTNLELEDYSYDDYGYKN